MAGNCGCWVPEPLRLTPGPDVADPLVVCDSDPLRFPPLPSLLVPVDPVVEPVAPVAELLPVLVALSLPLLALPPVPAFPALEPPPLPLPPPLSPLCAMAPKLKESAATVTAVKYASRISKPPSWVLADAAVPSQANSLDRGVFRAPDPGYRSRVSEALRRGSKRAGCRQRKTLPNR